LVASLDVASGRPVVVANNLRPAVSGNAPVFRGVTPPSREPQPNGIVTAVEDREVTVNVGSLDGLVKGTELEIPGGHIVIATVFRDRARGRASAGTKVRANDPVQVPRTVHLTAVSHEVEALAASGNLDGARTLARNALAAGSSGETRPLLERLAALDYQAGAIDAAREHFEAAANNLYQPPAASPTEQATILNSLGALYLLRGDAASAVKPLTQAATFPNIDRELQAQISNNFGVLAEIQGDVAKARDAYSRAAALQTIAQANLNRLASLKK
jgi:tetratricopeptide (TPR) repeat protein